MPTDLDIARDYVGDDDPEDAELLALIAEYGSPYIAARQILRRRRSNLLDGPASFSTDGYSENNTETIKQLSADIATLEAIIGKPVDTNGDGIPDNGFLTRPDRRWR